MQCYVLAAGGDAAVVRMLELIEDEMQRPLAMLGIATFAESRMIAVEMPMLTRPVRREQTMAQMGSQAVDPRRRRGSHAHPSGAVIHDALRQGEGPKSHESVTPAAQVTHLKAAKVH
jgi:hypothetical protein